MFGTRASQLSASILTADDEAQKQLSHHLFVSLLDFDEFSANDSILRTILFALSGSSPIFVRKPYGKDTDQFNWIWKSLLVILNLNCIHRIDTCSGEAAIKRFRVVERKDVRFTDKVSDVNIAGCVFPANDRVRKILSEPMAGAYYMDKYLRPFVKMHSWEDVVAIVNTPPKSVVDAATPFLHEAETGVPPLESRVKGQGTEDYVSGASVSAPSSVHLISLELGSGLGHRRWPSYLTRTEVMYSTIPGSKKPKTEQKYKNSKWSQHKWQTCMQEAVRVPELLYCDDTRGRLYYLQVNPINYDKMFAVLGLPCWHSEFVLKRAVESHEGGEIDTTEECEKSRRVAGEAHRTPGAVLQR